MLQKVTGAVGSAPVIPLYVKNDEKETDILSELKQMIRKHKLVKIIFAAVCGLSTVIAAATSNADPLFYGKVTNLGGDTLNVRAEATADSQWLGSLWEDETVTILSSSTDEMGVTWYEIDYNGSTAFANGNYIILDENMDGSGFSSSDDMSYNDIAVESFDASGSIYGLGGDTLNIRSGAGTGYDRFGSFTEGVQVEITGIAYADDGSLWYRLNYNGQDAYILGDYVSFTGNDSVYDDADTVELTAEYNDIPGTVINIEEGDYLNIREKPGTYNAAIGTLWSGETVAVTGETYDRYGALWYRIMAGYTEGYVYSDYISFGEVSYNTSASIGESIVQLAAAYAADDSHGYRNAGGDNTGFGPTGGFDCGGLVSRVLWDLGLLPENQLYEPNSGMQWVLANNGFETIGYDYSILQPGDILYRFGHTVIYAGNGMVVGAHGTNGYYEAGDQTGNEVSLCNFYGYYEYIFRYAG